MKILTPLEQRLSDYLGSERPAVVLAPLVSPDTADLEDAVIRALVTAKERVSGPTKVLYLSGCRRDKLREK